MEYLKEHWPQLHIKSLHNVLHVYIKCLATKKLSIKSNFVCVAMCGLSKGVIQVPGFHCTFAIPVDTR